MADIFSLAPEGLAWTDNAAQNKAARPEDYEPGFMAGSISALPRGIAEGAIGVLQSGVAADQKLISDPKYLQEFIPTYGAFKALFPEADQRITAAYDSTSKALERAREYIKPEPGTQGTAAQVIDGLGQFVPAMAISVFAGPAAGGVTAFGSTYEPSRQEFLSKGVDPETANTLALEQGAANAAGMALPAGVGGRLLTRLASGIGINTGFGAASRFAVSDTLEDNGYSDLAKQYQAWDKQALLVDGVLGAAFGGFYHWTAGKNPQPVNRNDYSQESLQQFFGDNYTLSDEMATESLVKQLSDNGVINIIRDENSAQGYTSSEDGVITLNLAAIEDGGSLAYTLSHEAFHSEIGRYSSKKYQRLLYAITNASDRAESGSVIGDSRKIVSELSESGEFESAPNPNALAAEETGAYSAGLYEDLSPSDVNQWREFTGKIKAGIYRTTGIQLGEVTAEQLNAMAKKRLSGLSLEASVIDAFGAKPRSSTGDDALLPGEQQPITTQAAPGTTAEPTYEGRIAELQNMSGQLMSRGDRKVWQSEIVNSERVITRLEAEDTAIRDAAPTGSSGANRRYYEANQGKLDEISSQLDGARQRLQEAQETLAPHQPNGQFYEAKADLSRLEQGIIPESMRGLVRETDIRPSDVDAAHVMNEGLHYDIESAPVAHGSIESVNAHVAAMDQAAAQLMRGDSVNVDQQIRGLDGVMKPDAIEQGRQQRAAMEEAFKENGVAYSPPREEPSQTPEPRQSSAFAGTAEDGARQVSTDPDTGTVISSNSYDLMAARDMSQSNPDINVLHPDTGEMVPLSKALADMDEQIAQVQKESRVYSVAAACFLRSS